MQPGNFKRLSIIYKSLRYPHIVFPQLEKSGTPSDICFCEVTAFKFHTRVQ